MGIRAGYKSTFKYIIILALQLCDGFRGINFCFIT